MASETIPEFKPGDPLSADPLERLRLAVERCRVSVEAPLEAHVGSYGTVLRYAGEDVLVDAVTTSDVGAASGANLGSGTIRICTRSGTTLTPRGRGDLVVYNSGGTVASGTYVTAGRVGNAWRLFVAPCPP